MRASLEGITTARWIDIATGEKKPILLVNLSLESVVDPFA